MKTPAPALRAALAAALLTGVPARADLVISEFLADNDGGLTDSFGEASDWIELRNPGDLPVSAAGLFLSDDPDEPTLWALPDIGIPAGGFLLIRASGRDLADPSGELHANFKLSRSAPASLLLSRMDTAGTVTPVSSFTDYPDQFEDTSYGLTLQDGSGAAGYFSNPTPGAANDGVSVLGYVEDTKFSIDRGFYDEAFDVTVTTATPGATLIYTLDGSWPSESNGTRIPAPGDSEAPSATVAVTTTTCLRAMAVKPGFEPTNVDTHTYVFPADVLLQDGQGVPYDQSVSWGYAGPDWEMDPEIVNHPDPAVRPVADDLKRVPTVSITMNFEEMFGAGGIYIAGQSVEKNVSIELLNPDNDVASPNEAEGFQVDGTIQVVGGTSPDRWKVDNLSLRLKFDRDLRYPVFGDEAVDRFDTLVLDAHLGDVWHYGGTSTPETQRGRAQYARDQFISDMHREIGGLSPHCRTVLLYINGIFWGTRDLHERPDDNFAASYLGGDNEDYNVVKHNINTAVSGNLDSYRELHDLADRDLSIRENFDAVADLLDIDAFIDYIALNYFLGNTDWGHQNWYASRNQSLPDGKWLFHSWDAENVMNFLTDNVTSRNNSGGPTNLQHDLAANAEYRLRFADRVHQLFHNGGALTAERTSEIYRRRTDPIDLLMRLESARWGDNHRQSPYTRLDWLDDRRGILGENLQGDTAFRDYFNARPDIVLGQLRNRGWYPDTEPPVFSTHGGPVSGDQPVTVTSPSGGTIYYTTDGSDPRVPPDGEIVETVVLAGEFATKRAIVPTNGSLGSTWTQTAFNDSSWPAGTFGAGYENSFNGDYTTLIDPALDVSSLVDNSTFESIYLRMEFDHSADTDINLLRLHVRYDDGFVAYLNGVEVHRENAPGTAGQGVAWNDQATAGHADSQAVGFTTFNISPHIGLLVQGRNVLAIHALNRGASSSDFLIWPTLEGALTQGDPNGIAEGAMEYTGAVPLAGSVTLSARVLRQGEWSPLTSATFAVDAVAPDPSNLVISKIHYHPSDPDAEEIAAGFTNDGVFEYLELMNVGAEAIDLTGVRFNEGITFSFDDSPVRRLEPGARTLIVRNPDGFAFRHGAGLPVAGVFADDTALSNSGEFLALVDRDEQVIHRFEFQDSAPWPAAADGSGPALVLVAPESAPDHSLATSWTTSVSAGGNPGLPENDDEIRFLLGGYFSPAEMANRDIAAPGADPDGDGRENFYELFFGSDPSVPDGGATAPEIGFDESGRIRLSFVRRSGFDAVDWTVEGSARLAAWQDETDRFTITTTPDDPLPGFERVTLVAEPGEGSSEYFRVRLTTGP